MTSVNYNKLFKEVNTDMMEDEECMKSRTVNRRNNHDDNIHNVAPIQEDQDINIDILENPTNSTETLYERQRKSEIQLPKQNVKIIFLILTFILAVQSYGVMLDSLALTQYSHAYIQKELFPNSKGMNKTKHTAYCNDTKSFSFKKRTKVQQETTKFLLIAGVAHKVPTIISSLIVSAASDTFGRKRLLIFIYLVDILKPVGFFLIMFFDVDIYYLIAVNALHGLSGGYQAALSVSMAFVADLTKASKERTFVITILELSMGIGATVSGFSSGYLIKQIDYKYCILISAGLFALSLLLIWLGLKDHQPFYERSSLRSSIGNVFKFYRYDTTLTAKRWKYILCLFIFAVAHFANVAKSIDALYELNFPFCWSSVKIGWYAAARALASTCVGVGAVKVIQTFTTASEAIIAIVSSMSSGAANVLEALSYNDLMLFLVPVVGILGILFIPMLKAIVSKMSPPDKQGAIFASIASVSTLFSLLGDISAKAIYMATVATYRGFIYLVLCGYDVIVIVLLIVFIVGSRRGINS